MKNSRIAKREFPTPAEIRELPLQHRFTIPADWRDRNGHVNVQYYLRLYDLGGYEILEGVQVGEEFMTSQNFGLFDIEHHISFRSEVLVNNTVSSYNRLLSVGETRFHGMYFIVNDSEDRLACTIEYLSVGVDLGTRRSAPFPALMKEALDALLTTHSTLGWAAPVCGAMNVRA